MGDGTNKRGGARAGAGRKTKAAEDDLSKIFRKCVSKSDREEIVKKWAQDAQSDSFTTRHKSRTSLFAYLYGKPVERHEVTGAGGGPVETVGMTLDDWRNRSAERSAQAAEAMSDFEEDEESSGTPGVKAGDDA